MKRRMIAGLFVAALLVSAGGVLAIIAFPDSDNVPDNIVSTDTAVAIDLSVSPASAVLSRSNIVPGDVFNGELVLSNAAQSFAVNSALSVSHAGDAALPAALVLAINEATCAGGPYLDADGLAINGAPIFIGSYATAGTLGTVAMGARDTATLCLTLALPASEDILALSSLADDATFIIDTDVP